MREIKFRAWDDRKKKMIFGPTDDNPQPSWVFTMCQGAVWFKAPCMQSTGLIGTNGDIYEGDIVDVGDYGPSQVVWDVMETGFRLKELKIKDGEYAPRTHDIFYSGVPTVIGNIHANQELLTP